MFSHGCLHRAPPFPPRQQATGARLGSRGPAAAKRPGQAADARERAGVAGTIGPTGRSRRRRASDSSPRADSRQRCWWSGALGHGVKAGQRGFEARAPARFWETISPCRPAGGAVPVRRCFEQTSVRAGRCFPGGREPAPARHDRRFQNRIGSRASWSASKARVQVQGQELAPGQVVARAEQRHVSGQDQRQAARACSSTPPPAHTVPASSTPCASGCDPSTMNGPLKRHGLLRHPQAQAPGVAGTGTSRVVDDPARGWPRGGAQAGGVQGALDQLARARSFRATCTRTRRRTGQQTGPGCPRAARRRPAPPRAGRPIPRG